MRGHEGRKFTQRSQSRDEPRSEAVIQSESVFVTFAISVCKIPFRKDVPHADREDRNETDELRIEGPHNPNRSLRPLRSLCVKAR